MSHLRRGLLAACLLWCLLPAFAWNGDAAGKDAKKGWDVADFTDETYEIELDTDEGTWMSLDVSPDGSHVVFDLLGDIYIMPIGGGDATALTSGLPWDMQPRFSPDGTRIAFTSDRGGGDNIWTMARDGSDMHQVTKETFRLLNSPAWSPDGKYIVARKHFTSTRSLGAGEIWMYHAQSKGSGIQLNKRPNQQKDLGEPAYSHDGRYVYFSRDTTSGGIFEYSKDPNPGIYSIRRIDLHKGGIETVISGTGGAVRPTPSPDGKSLAFVRRHNYDTKLWIHDFESGTNRIVYHKLDRDMQETWAIHGVYPTMGWMPDSKGIVFWADGKIKKLDLASGKAEVIPFRVKQKHTMVNTIAFDYETAPDETKTHMLRWTRVSPQGDKVVFQALGHLYIRDVNGGEAKRLTNQNDAFEYYPSWSRDGKSVVFVTHHDEDLGAVWTVPASGGTPTRITKAKGHYSEPVFSPDGETIVYRRISGGYLVNPAYSGKTGIYKISGDGEPERIATSGRAPHFGADSDRLFYLSSGSGGKLLLKSISLDGKDDREHLSSGMGAEFAVSPNGQWVTLMDNWKVHVMPFTLSSQSVSVTPAGGNMPAKTLSAQSGEWIHWSGDSQKVHWTLGSMLYSRDLKDAFAFVEGAPEELPQAVEPTDGIDLGFTYQAAKPDTVVALTNARIVTMKGDEIIKNGVVLVEGNRIKAVGPKNKVKIPAGAVKQNVAGHTIIPGIIDVHAHGGQGFAEMIPQQNWSSHGHLAFGVTTIHDPSSDTSTIFAASEMQRAGMIVAPRTYSTGTIIYGATIPGFSSKINSYDDAVGHVNRLKAAGAFSIKSYNQPRRNQRQQVINAAREAKILVMPEGGSLFQHNMTMVADGHTGVEHNIPVARIYDDVVQFWSQTKTQHTPTLGVSFGGISGEHYWYHHTNVWEHPLLTNYVPPYILESRARRRTMAPEMEYNHIRSAEVCKKLSDAGVLINIGAHGQREGLASHWEMWMLNQGGMTPMECLRAATINGATYLGMEKDLGTIEVGKLADMVIIKGKPDEDIRQSDQVVFVMQNGRLFEAATLNEVGTGDFKRKPYFFQMDGGVAPANNNWTKMRAVCHGCSRH